MVTRLRVLIVLVIGFLLSVPIFGSRPLLEQFPVLSQHIPHLELTEALPTPLFAMCNLGAHYGVHLFCKDDGKTGIEFGGNKVRKLEFLLADAIEHKAQAVITLGGAGSNHALATAAYAKKLGLKAYLLLTPQQITQYTRRNLLLDRYVDAIIEYFPTRDLRNTRLLALIASKRMYYIPVGGSNELGSVGFVNAAFELKEQCDGLGIAYPDYIYLPFGSYGTICGLLVGLKAAGLGCKIVGVSTDEGQDFELARQNIVQRSQMINEYIRDFDDQFPLLEFSAEDLEIRGYPAGYAQVIKEVQEVLAIMREQEHVQLDTTYSGRAAAALLDDLAHNDALRSKNILFWKTYSDGAYEAETSTVSYKDLPEALHSYFEQPLQLLDDQGC